ncbi:MAG TPA: Blp family class II bacteriocin [Rhodopila sp.]
MSATSVTPSSTNPRELSAAELEFVSGGTHSLGEHVAAGAAAGAAIGGSIGGGLGAAVGGAIGAVAGFIGHLLE